MNRCLLVLALIWPIQSLAIDIHGPSSWIEHGVIAAAISIPFYDSEYRWWASGVICAGFLIRESTQRGGAFNDLDSNMDWIVPCVVTSGISVLPTIIEDGFGLSFFKSW